MAQEGCDGFVEVVDAAVFPRSDTGAKPLRDQEKPDLVDGGLHRRQLRQNLAAFRVFGEHSLYAANLALRALQPRDELLTGLRGLDRHYEIDSEV